MSSLRITKDLKEYEMKEYRRMMVTLDETNPFRQRITVALDPDLGYSITLEVLYPQDYPTSPPNVSLVECSNPNKLFYTLQKVCPDIVCWRPHDLFDPAGIRLGPKIFQAIEWSTTTLTVPALILTFITRLKKRLRGMSLETAYPLISDHIPDLRASNRQGSAKIVFGANAEGVPTSVNMGPQFVLLMDPMMSHPSSPATDENATSLASNMHCYQSQETTYVQLAAPWCYKDPDSWKTMECLLAQLAEKGYTDIKAYQSGISLKMPNDLPILPYYRLATGPGTRVITPGDYGG